MHADLEENSDAYDPSFYSPGTSYQYDHSLASELSRVSPRSYRLDVC